MTKAKNPTLPSNGNTGDIIQTFITKIQKELQNIKSDKSSDKGFTRIMMLVSADTLITTPSRETIQALITRYNAYDTLAGQSATPGTLRSFILDVILYYHNDIVKNQPKMAPGELKLEPQKHSTSTKYLTERAQRYLARLNESKQEIEPSPSGTNQSNYTNDLDILTSVMDKRISNTR